MIEQERRAWAIVASLFFTLFLIFGSGYNTAGVFFTPLLRQFGWSRAQLSTLQSVLALAAGLSTPLIGWLLDRVEARLVMVTGVVLSGLSFVLASQVHSFAPMLLAYCMLGLGIAFATLLPVSLVVANWFSARRGMALGITMAGTTIGGMVMTMVANQAIARGGWRAGYLTLAAPMFLVAMPLVVVMVRTRPAGSAPTSVAQAAQALPGLEIREAMRARSFWLISLAQFCFALAASGAVLHLITYLIGIGYPAVTAALVMSLVFGATSVGKFSFGMFADRVSGRVALAICMGTCAVGMLVLLAARLLIALAAFVLIFGFTMGVPLVLVPIVMVESLGLKRFGSLAGIAGIFNAVGAAIGPVVAGRIFDVNSSYNAAFELFTVVLIVGGLATLGCLPLGQESGGAEHLAATA